MSSVTIRPARPDDAETILAMIRDLARFEMAEHAVKASAADLRRDGWGADRKFEALIAELDGGAVGFALFFHTYSTWEGRAGIYVEDIYVADAARGRGVGRRLMTALARLTVQRRCARLDLSVLDWNPACGFYESLGLTRLAEWLPYRATGAALAALAQEPGDD